MAAGILESNEGVPLELDELRDLASLVIQSGFRELGYARTCVRRISPEFECSDAARAQYIVQARERLHTLDHAIEFYRGEVFERWAGVLDLTDGEVDAIREKYERESAPIRASLRAGLEQIGAAIERRASPCRRV